MRLMPYLGGLKVLVIVSDLEVRSDQVDELVDIVFQPDADYYLLHMEVGKHLTRRLVGPSSSSEPRGGTIRQFLVLLAVAQADAGAINSLCETISRYSSSVGQEAWRVQCKSYP
jgi:hypothetical protein